MNITLNKELKESLLKLNAMKGIQIRVLEQLNDSDYIIKVTKNNIIKLCAISNNKLIAHTDY